jgi:hypothetical protein
MLLQEGDIVLLETGHEVYATIPKHFAYANCVGDFDLCREKITIGKTEVNNGLDTRFMTGKWIVYKTTPDGGGTGHGPGDVYPDGHHVFCIRAEQNPINYKMKIDFYQTGSFTAMIEEGKIKIVGKAKATWEIEE